MVLAPEVKISAGWIRVVLAGRDRNVLPVLLVAVADMEPLVVWKSVLFSVARVLNGTWLLLEAMEGPSAGEGESSSEGSASGWLEAVVSLDTGTSWVSLAEEAGDDLTVPEVPVTPLLEAETSAAHPLLSVADLGGLPPLPVAVAVAEM